jgi:hypothetical protein
VVCHAGLFLILALRSGLFSALFAADIRRLGEKLRTPTQESTFLENKGRLVKKLEKLQAMQRAHRLSFPALVIDQEKPYDTTITFPSSLDATLRDQVTWLCRAEDGLREALAREALEALLRQLRTRDVALDFKNQHVRGVRGCTRMNDTLKAVVIKVKAAADAYRRHHRALTALRSPGTWSLELQPLLDSDVRGINERALTTDEAAQRSRARELARDLNETPQDLDDFGAQEGVGGVYLGRAPVQIGDSRRALSWIWCNTSMLENSDPRLSSKMAAGILIIPLSASFRSDRINPTALRIEWSKSKARAARWQEEVALLSEEMRRSLAFAQAEAVAWRSLAAAQTRLPAVSGTPASACLLEGRQSYCLQKVAIYNGLRSKWVDKWSPVILKAKQSTLGKHVVDLGIEINGQQSTGLSSVIIEVHDDDDTSDNVKGSHEDGGPLDEVDGIDSLTYH